MCKNEKTVDRQVRLQAVKLRGRYLISSNILHLSDNLDVTMKILINTQTNRSDFISIINQLDAQNLFYNKFISCVYMFRAPCAHRQEVKIVLYSLWYHHTYRWPFRAPDGHL